MIAFFIEKMLQHIAKPMAALPNTATLLKGFQHRLPQFQGISH